MDEQIRVSHRKLIPVSIISEKLRSANALHQQILIGDEGPLRTVGYFEKILQPIGEASSAFAVPISSGR